MNGQFPGLALKDEDEIELDLGIEEQTEGDKEKKEEYKEKEKEKDKEKDKEKEKEKKKERKRSRSRERRKKDKHRSRSRHRHKSRSRDRHRHKSRDRQKRNRHRSRSAEEQRVKEGMEYEGIVTKITDYGCFIRLPNKREGLCHISKMSGNRPMQGRDRRKPSEIVAVEQKVKVKVEKIEGNRMQLAIKEGEQEERRKIQLEHQLYVEREDQNGNKMKYGTLTGVKIDESGEINQVVKKMTSPELWEQSRLKYNDMWEGGEQEVQEFNKETDIDIELNDKEAPFLRGQTGKAGI